MKNVWEKRVMRMDEKERKTGAEVDGQCRSGLEGEGTVGRGDAKPGCVEAICQIHHPTCKWEKMWVF